MNWQTFQINNQSQERAFECLCNQLFENWVQETYSSELSYFTVTNGAGGDGGVESYAILKDKTTIGLQAKWFPNVIETSHIKQIKSSIQTTMKIRPNTGKYIVCVPRNLASKTGRNTKDGDYEEKRWLTLVEEIKKQYPTLELVLWNDHAITKELEKPTSVGVLKYWFHNSEISYDKLVDAFKKSKESWLINKYVPDLNCYGKVYKTIINYLGDINTKEYLLHEFSKINSLVKELKKTVDDLIDRIKEKSEKAEELKRSISELKNKADVLANLTDKILENIENDISDVDNTTSLNLNFEFGETAETLRRDSFLSDRYWHTIALTSILSKLDKFDLFQLFSDYQQVSCTNNIIIKGDPGTGKSHGVASAIEKILTDKYHAGIIIHARDIEKTKSWKDIVLSNLGLSSNWEEDELWQALLSMININKTSLLNTENAIRITPKVLIAVDGIDESSTTDKWEERVREAKVISNKYPQIRFCVTTRPFLFKEKIDKVDVCFLSSNGDAKVSELFDNYIKHYQVNVSNSPLLKNSLTTPLALKLFCELYQGKTFDFDNDYDVSLPELLGRKIQLIETEFSKKVKEDIKNQYILKALKEITEYFFCNKNIEYNDLVSLLASKVVVDKSLAITVSNYLNNYGILSCYCQHGSLFLGNKYFYSPGLRSYFDHASTIIILEKFADPALINFEEYKNLSTDTLYGLAAVSIRKYGYLITQNESLSKIADDSTLAEIQYWALINSTAEAAEKYKPTIIEKMGISSSLLYTTVNRLILPLSRKSHHPLGVSLLNAFLTNFDKPAQRDIMWSETGYLKDSYNKKWNRNISLEILEDYPLVKTDKYDGLPTVYAWSLSALNNTLRTEYRQSLMRWALTQPSEFIKLFYEFSNVNDPQILNDLYSILLCVAYETNDKEFVKSAFNWISNHILSSNGIDGNRSIAIRYYSIAIVYKAIELEICDKEDIIKFLPPYSANNYKIKLDKGALSGTRMSGYRGINYDLSRYVLIDHIESNFNRNNQKNKQLLKEFLSEVCANLDDCSEMKFEQFILSSAHAFITDMGWNENEFKNYNVDKSTGKKIGGFDCSILETYYQADHGAQSKVMSVCEKYVWMARDYIYGFLCDRLNFGDTKDKLTDYGMLQNFIIPMQEINQINPDDIPEENPWYIPEKHKFLSSLDCHNKEDVVKSISESSDINWMDWIFVKNNDRYKIPAENLLALYGFCCFEMPHMETCLFINSIIVDKSSISLFVNHLKEGDNYIKISSVNDLSGGIESDCYITPKECCWFNWKKHYEAYALEDFSSYNLHCATDKGCWSHNEFGDMYYCMPSPFVRSLLGINDSDGYLFFDSKKNIQAERTIAGKIHHTYQEYLFVDKKNFLDKLESGNKTMLWIMKEYRRENGLSKEKFGDFYVDKTVLSIGYFEERKFVALNLNKTIEKT